MKRPFAPAAARGATPDAPDQAAGGGALPTPRGSADSKAMAYRPDVDGLRAIAVLSVVFYHFSERILPGGFLGVDVFFVISGYLITLIILREAEAGKFSIAKFYERRVRRIAPALLLMLATVTAASALILLPLDLIGYAKSVLATLGFVSNVYFWRDGNYFAAAAEYKPLLHTWTLGVEEQFYILFPLLVAVLARRPRYMLYGVVAALAAASLVANIAALRLGATLPAFYLLPTRAWELGAGALLAMTPPRAISPRLNAALAFAGLALVLLALAAAPMLLPGELPTPLPAVLGAVLLIWTGANGQTPVSRGLSLSIPVAIGLISYSLYLWHWPIIVLYRYYFVAEIGVADAIIAFAVMVALAAFSWRYVERPFREKRVSTRQVYAVAAGGAALVALGAAGLIFAKGLPQRLDPAAARINAAISTHYRCPVSSWVTFGPRYACMLPPGSPEEAGVILLGNSHAQMYAPLVAETASRRALKTLLVPANGCAPLVGVNISRNCIKVAEGNIEAAAGHRGSKVVVLAFEWHIEDRLVDRAGRPAAGHAALIRGLDASIGRLQAAGKQVVLVGPIAVPGYDFASRMSRTMAFGRPADHPVRVPLAGFTARVAPYLDHYGKRGDIVFVAPHRAQCPAEACEYMIGGESLFSDSNHIARAALHHFATSFEQGLGSALAPARQDRAVGAQPAPQAAPSR